MANLGADLSGRLIGEYQAIRRIGVGGMGVVYEGVQPLIGKRVAIKTLLPSVSSDPVILERFLTEARAVNAIRHRGIVDIFSFGALEDRTQYLVMEFLEGRDFSQIIAESAPLSPLVVIRWMAEIGAALSAAHDAGVIHRDLKPSNVFLVERGGAPYVKVLDFGAAKTGVPKEGREQSHASVVIGTPEYIAPEQAQADAVSPKTDAYALGCIAFELLTARLPFEGESPIQTMFMHVTAKVPRASQVMTGLPKKLDDLIYELMAKEPSERPDLRTVARRLSLLEGELTRGELGAPAEATVVQRPKPPLKSAPGSYERTWVGQEPVAPAKASSTQPLSVPLDAVGPAPTQETPRVTEPGALEPTPVAAPPTASDVTPAASPRAGQLAARTLVPAVVAFALVVGAGWLLIRPKPSTAPVAEPPSPQVDVPAPPQPVEPKAKPEPEPSPPPEVKPALAPPAPAVAPKKRSAPPTGPTESQLQARVQALEERIAGRERDRGRADAIGRNYLTVSRARVAEAKTAESRRDALRFIEDVERELDRQP